MMHGITLGVLHQFVGWLLYPVIIALGFAVLLTVWEIGQTLAEKFVTLKAFARTENSSDAFEAYATLRLERTDLLARSGPILGLMGTLIPLGPGLAALGSGNLETLSTALIVAFDTTVVGLLVGLVAYVLSRVRRRKYEHVWRQIDALTQSSSQQS